MPPGGVGRKKKRGKGDKNRPAASATPAFIELSHRVTDGLVTFNGLPAPTVCDFWTHAGTRGNFADPDTSFCMQKATLVGSTGTYVDAPLHRFPKGDDVSGVPLASLVSPAVVARFRGRAAIDRESLVSELRGRDVKGRFAIVETGWSARWGAESYRAGGHPHLTRCAAEYLVARGVAAVGIDSNNIDQAGAECGRPVHTVLLGSGVPIVENMTGLDALRDGDVVHAVPPPIVGMGSFPVRAFATRHRDPPDSGGRNANDQRETTAPQKKDTPPSENGTAPNSAAKKPQGRPNVYFAVPVPAAGDDGEARRSLTRAVEICAAVDPEAASAHAEPPAKWHVTIGVADWGPDDVARVTAWLSSDEAQGQLFPECQTSTDSNNGSGSINSSNNECNGEKNGEKDDDGQQPSTHPPITERTASLAEFGQFGGGRVLWAGFDRGGVESLRKLRGRLSELLGRNFGLSLAGDGKPIEPHVTLFKQKQQRRRWKGKGRGKRGKVGGKEGGKRGDKDTDIDGDGGNAGADDIGDPAGVATNTCKDIDITPHGDADNQATAEQATASANGPEKSSGSEKLPGKAFLNALVENNAEATGDLPLDTLLFLRIGVKSMDEHMAAVSRR